VVGVVDDVKHWGLDGEVRPEMYVPLAQRPTPFLNLVVRSRIPPSELVAAVRDQVRSLDPDLPLSAVRTLQDVLDTSLAPRRFFMVLLGSFAGLALGLACVGTYSVFAFTVARRAREIGIRMAMGAQTRQVLGLVLGQGVRLALAGVVVGVAGALVLTRFLRTAVFGVGIGDPATYAGVTAVVVLVALAACWIPARRATRVEPMTALRDE
jgi:putative ABC transport system permease protein